MREIAPSVPISDSSFSSGGRLVWVLYAPCGCRYAILSAAIRVAGSELWNECLAWQAACYSQVHEARMHRQGFRWQLEVSGAENSHLSDCSHSSDYQPDIWVVLDGYTWAADSMASPIEHLVPYTDVDQVEFVAFGYSGTQVAPLCSSAMSSPWWKAIGTDPCPDCERLAGRSITP